MERRTVFVRAWIDPETAKERHSCRVMSQDGYEGYREESWSSEPGPCVPHRELHLSVSSDLRVQVKEDSYVWPYGSGDALNLTESISNELGSTGVIRRMVLAAMSAAWPTEYIRHEEICRRLSCLRG